MIKKNSMEFKKSIKENAQTIIAIGTVIGMVIGVLNFFILTRISPIEKRVDAIETSLATYMPLDLSLEKWKNNDAAHIMIDKKLDYIIEKLDSLK